MNDDVFMFAKDRYFIGEVVDVVLGGEKYLTTSHSRSSIKFILRFKEKYFMNKK